MKFTKIENIEIEKRKLTDLENFIIDFQNAHIKYAKIEEYGNRTTTSIQSAINKCAKRIGRPHIQCIIRNGIAYLKNSLVGN